MYYTYILKNSANELYYGYTKNLKQRLDRHRKNDKKIKLVYYEAYSAETDARTRERKLKQYGQSRSHLKKRIKNSLAL
ncbi:MAG TPA: GIY-YIG nuclease family protein [Candidatus Omnitrophica bacterium]|nr:GIY-YIG nuclease family protein [Candidatus Omnitrophota bacterium]